MEEDIVATEYPYCDQVSLEIYRRYAGRLMALARSRLSPQLQPRVDPEDILQSVFRSFFSKPNSNAANETDSEDLWPLLAKITVRKCARQMAKQCAARRDVRRESTGDADLPSQEQQLEERMPTPEEAAIFEDLLTKLLSQLPSKKREWLILRLQGHTIAEISEQVGRTERSIYRYLESARVAAIELELIE